MGSNFVRHALAQDSNSKITVLDALTYSGSLRNLESIQDSITFVKGSILDQELVDSLVENADAVVHFAAESHNDRSLVNPRIFTEVNVLGTESIARACVKFNKRMHHVSTDEIFGDLPLDSHESFTEQSQLIPSSPYSASKAASDLLVQAWVRSFGLNATISNSANNYGVNQFPEKLIPRTIALVRDGQKPQVYGNGMNIRDWLFVDDHSSAVLKILKEGRCGERYVVSGNQLRSNIEIVGYILDAFGLPKDHYDLVIDRPGHDLKYSSNSDKLRKSTGWKPVGPSVSDWIYEYVRNLGK